MSSLNRPAVLVLALLALLVACGESSDGGDHDLLALPVTDAAPQRVPAEFRALLPDDTLFYLQASSAAALARDMSALGGSPMPGPPDRFSLMTAVALFSPAGALTVDDVDTDKPLGFAMHWPEGSMAPQLMTLFFRADGADFEARLGDAFSLVREGAAVRAALRDDDASAPPSGGAALPDELAAGRLALWIDLRSALAHPGVRAGYDAMAAMMAMQFSNPPPGMPDMSGMQDMLDLEVALIRESFDELQQLDLGAGVVDGVLRVHGDLELREGSALGDFDAGDTSDLSRVSGILDPDAPVLALIHGDWSQLRARSAPLLQRLAMQDEQIAELLGELLATGASFSGTQGMEFRSITEMRMRSFLASDDPAAGVTAMLESVPRLAGRFGGISYSAPTRREIDGVTVSTFTVDDAGAIATMTPANPMLSTIENQTVSLFHHDGFVMSVQGADVDAEVAGALRALDAGGGAPAPGVARMLDRFADVGAGLALRMKLAPLVREMARTLGAPVSDSDADPVLDLFFGNRGAHWTFDFGVDAAGLAELMQR